MKNIKFYPSIWQMSPYSLDLAAYLEAERKRNLDLTLNNTQANQLKVAEMSLNINGFAVIDQQGKEIRIDEFTQQPRLQIKGQQTGLYIKTRQAARLPEGQYQKVRFYLKPWDNRFILNDFSTKEIFNTDYLDFEIVGGLTIKNEDAYNLRLRFNLTPYTFKGIVRLLRHKVLGKMKPNLAHGFAN